MDNDRQKKEKKMSEQKTESKAMTKTESKTMTNKNLDTCEQFGNLDDCDMSIPYISLVQGTSDAAKNGVCDAGKWYNSLTNEGDDKINIIPLSIRKERSLIVDRKLLCKSSDTKTPDNSIDAPFSEKCGIDYSDKKNPVLLCQKCDKKLKNGCKQGYKIVCLLIGDDINDVIMPAIINLSGSNFKTINQIHTISRVIKKVPYHGLSLTLLTKKSDDEHGNYVSVATNIKAHDPNDFKAAAMQFAYMKSEEKIDNEDSDQYNI